MSRDDKAMKSIGTFLFRVGHKLSILEVMPNKAQDKADKDSLYEAQRESSILAGKDCGSINSGVLTPRCEFNENRQFLYQSLPIMHSGVVQFPATDSTRPHLTTVKNLDSQTANDLSTWTTIVDYLP